jgi:plasmid stability protein
LQRHANLHLEMQIACYGCNVPKTVQIRDLDDEVYAGLARRAAEVGVSVPEFLRAEATRLAARPSVEEWLSLTRRRRSALSRLEVLAALDEQRGSWPDAGG